MNRKSKSIVIVTLVLFSLGILALIYQQPLAFVMICGLLIGVTLYFESVITASALAGILVALYPLPNFGSLYGRDSHGAARIAYEISRHGWPIPDSVMLAWAYPGTPLMHIHAVITSLMSGLLIYPSPGHQLLVTNILPIFYLAATLVITYLIARQLASDFGIPSIYGVLPLLVWIPLYSDKSAFRRQSLGFLFVILISFTLLTDRNRKINILSLVFLGAAAMTHHISSIVAAIFVVAVATGRQLPYGFSQNAPRTTIVAVFSCTVVIIWQIQTGVLEALVVPLAGLSLATIDTASSTFEQNALTLIRLASKWIYQIILATGLLIGVIYGYRQRKLNWYEIPLLLFSVVIGILTIAVWKSSLFVPHRMMTFFVGVAGCMSLFGFSRIQHVSSRKILRIVTITLILLSAPIVPLHAISDQSPNYSQQQTSQRYSAQDYAVAYFINNWGTAQFVIGDANTAEIVVATAQTPVQTQADAVRRTHIPQESLVSLASRNRHIYFGPSSFTGWTYFDPKSLIKRYDRNHNRVYSSGQHLIFV